MEMGRGEGEKRLIKREIEDMSEEGKGRVNTDMEGKNQVGKLPY